MGPYLQKLRSRMGKQCILLPGVRAIILNDKNEVLHQRRTDMDFWGLPSGSVELDESALEALVREVQEETGLKVGYVEPMALYSGPGQSFKYPNGDEIQCFSLAFIIRSWKGKLRVDGIEGSELQFWPLDSLPANLIEIHAETLKDFRQYDGRFLLPGNRI